MNDDREMKRILLENELLWQALEGKADAKQRVEKALDLYDEKLTDIEKQEKETKTKTESAQRTQKKNDMKRKLFILLNPVTVAIILIALCAMFGIDNQNTAVIALFTLWMFLWICYGGMRVLGYLTKMLRKWDWSH